MSAAVVTPLGGHVDTIRSVLHPTTPKELQCFLDIVNFYRRFLPGGACILQPLTEALKGNPKVLEWSGVLRGHQGGRSGDGAVGTPPPPGGTVPGHRCLWFPIGSVLQQLVSTHWQHLAFFSAKLTPPQQRYSASGSLLSCAPLPVSPSRSSFPPPSLPTQICLPAAAAGLPL